MSMNSADCKAMIVQIMKNLCDATSPVDHKAFRKDYGVGLGQINDPKLWKSASKSGKEGSTTRVFKHDLIDAVVTLQEVTNDDGTVMLEVDMTRIPRVLQIATATASAISLTGSKNVGASTARRVDPKTSMLDGPKPEGFGAFS